MLSIDFTKAFDCGAWRRVRDGARAALPQRCALCVADAGGELVCAACAAALPALPQACPTCALPTAGFGPCGACLAHAPPFAATIAAYTYAFPVDRLLQELKYGGRLALADWAGGALGRAVARSLAARSPADAPDAVVALPLGRERQRARGFNQAQEIAVRVAGRVGLRTASLLARTAETAPQSELSWPERAANIRGAFSADEAVRGRHLAIVDDVMTTGATLAEAARTLLRGGAQKVECWVVARTLREDGA